MSAKRGAAAAIWLLMPVKDSMYGGMEHSGFTSESHVSTSSPFFTRMRPISVIRSYAAFAPVVSKSTKTRSSGRSSAAAIERQQGVIQIRSPIPKHAPGVAVAAHLIQIEGGGQHRFAD